MFYYFCYITMDQKRFFSEVKKLSEMAQALVRQCEAVIRYGQLSTQPQSSQLRALANGLIDEELRHLLLPKNKYSALVRFLHSSAGQALFPKGSQPTWLERAVVLSELAGWTVDEQLLRRESRRQDKATT